MRYPRLFEPLAIGPWTARNRIVFGSHFTMFSEPSPVYGEPGYYGERVGRYLAERARGGAGVIILGQTQVHPTTAYQMSNNAAAWREESVEHFERVTQPIREHGALAFIQLAHNGGVNAGAWSKLPALAPSHVVNYTEPPKPLEKHEIRDIVDHFARSALNAARGGFQGIEIHGAHGYLIHEFLSPKSNQRTDEYGGPLENRMRFAVQVLRAVRAAVGDGVAVGMRMVGDEEIGDSGLGPEDSAEIGARLEELGLVDFLNSSIGLSGLGQVRPNYSEPGFATYTAAATKRRVRQVPVFAAHRILTPAQAEAILERGEADAVTVVRAQIADPEWAAKAREDRAPEIRRCTGSNQSCYGNLLQGLPINCVQNPAVGRETELGAGTLVPAEEPGRVVVVGGGPAGLEAAWVAAARGHRVTLLERGAELGGKIRLAQRLPGRAELADFADWRIGECERRGVDLRTGQVGSRESVLALEPDAVVVATGGRATKTGSAKWHAMPVPGSERDFVLDHEQALERIDELGPRVLVLDVVGHIEGLGIAEMLAERGREVSLAMPLATPSNLDGETAGAVLPRAVRAGVNWLPSTRLAKIGDGGEARLVDLLSDRELCIAVDHVVIRTHGLPVDDLYWELRDEVPLVARIGDAIAVRPADRAIFDGHRVAREL
ncbi:MAG: FAD-dependent oxidoreductase [Proteobacteria bacterium]|nr:FAD-dependent oxidoreductase [Pseudomonadota bacterium]